jgi:2-polyprenyl-3-methyl-5-hydroxy-6-metoxy-1,4-benzoquinol methylase
MTSLSVDERQKYERIWTFPEYRDDHVTAFARQAIEVMKPAAGDSLIDFGAGAGYASVHLQDAGLRVLAVDIAINAMAPDIATRVPRLIGNLWDMPVDIAADWGFCCDVMEHIPTEQVAAVLRFIRRSTRRATFMTIALRPDSSGRLIGQPLHLTVQNADWWTQQVLQHWISCEVVDHQPNHVVTFVAR